MKCHRSEYLFGIFNPLSQDDLETPHYRNEIRDGIELVKNLQKIKTKEIVFAKEKAIRPMKIGMKHSGTTTVHHYEIIVLENLQLLEQDTSPIQLSIVECEVSDGTTKRQFPNLNALMVFD